VGWGRGDGDVRMGTWDAGTCKNACGRETWDAGTCDREHGDVRSGMRGREIGDAGM